MIKYDNKLIMNYLNGEDIEEYDIDKLENNYDFMYQVITISNDKRMYNYCSDKLKKDYRLVKYLINKYNDDLKYITEIADNFLESVENESERIEILIIMDNYLSKENKKNKYNILLSAIYSKERVDIEIYKSLSKDDETNNELGMGFLLMYDDFNNNKLVIDYLASKTIEAIFSEYDINLEEYLHNQYKDFKLIEKQGINKLLIKFIAQYDGMLSSYLSTNVHLLKSLVERTNKIKVNWTNYNRRKEFKIYNNIFEEVSEYMEEYGEDCTYSEITLLCYIGMKLGIGEKIKEYYGIEDVIYDSIINTSNELFNNFSIEINDIKHIKKIKEIMLKYIKENSQKSNFDKQENNNQKNTSYKILEFKSQKPKK